MGREWSHRAEWPQHRYCVESQALDGPDDHSPVATKVSLGGPPHPPEGGRGHDRCRRVQAERTGHAPAVMGILRTIQRNLETDVSIGLLRDRIGRQPWILAAALP